MHEMIHLHEAVINELPLFYHDMMIWALYRKLRERIDKLDEIINDHAHLLNGTELFKQGGNHDILFLLKSFDLDIIKGLPLGTVFAYGKAEEYAAFEYIYQNAGRLERKDDDGII